MNDFTKEELENILTCVHVVCASSTISCMNYGELNDKIQSMIENYCEHQSDGKVYELQPEYKCKNCGEFYI